MECPNCGHGNAQDAKFCARCGTGLTVTCGVCSTNADPGAAFCTNCGAALGTGASGEGELARYLPQELLTKLESARAGRAMQGERRTVTMLFADIKGSTAAAEKLDPEDWAEIINGAFEHLIAPVYHYEGTLARLQGDAVLAFFGAPIAHEDDPVRALRAGLEIIQAIGAYRQEIEGRWGVAIEARVGIHTGLVVVGEVGSDLRVEYTALGDAINVAARMEQSAEPGTVLVTDHTRSLTGGAFEFEPLGPVEVKGKAEPVVAHRVLRFIGDHDVVSPTVLVGRSHEMGRLESLRSQLASGSGWIVSVTADAGVGKSRLLREFRDSTEAATMLASRYDQPGEMAWMTGAGRSYETATPFAATGDLLSRWWGLVDADEPFERVESALASIECTYPDGLDTEIFRFEALEKAWKEARLQSEREHVTPYILKRPELFQLGSVKQEEDLSALRWTVDTPPDLEFVRTIYNLFKDVEFGMTDILKLLKEHPEVLEINSGQQRNEGYEKSLQEDSEAQSNSR
ncbi:MAG: adenylate/guanylate cyclase domain-containing protein [Nitrospira sp.]